ncbi:hypothetical protein KR067_001639, partial [Drosophila pandora]
CPKEVAVVKMKKYIRYFSDTINVVRNKVATGKFRNLPKAARMARVVWSNELAWFAKLMLSNCESNLHQCMSSPNFYYIGSINQRIVVEHPTPDTKYATLSNTLNRWLVNVKGISRRMTLKLPRAIKTTSALNAALLISERLTHFGCASVIYTLSNKRIYTFICTFSTDIFPGQGLYKWGADAGSLCKQRDSRYKGLCSIQEEYSNNKPSHLGGTM